MVIEVVRAIILGVKRFWLPSIVSPLGVVEILAENAPIEVIVNNFVIYRNKAAKFSSIIELEDAHITYKFCKNRAIRGNYRAIRGNYIGKIRFFQFWGP